MRTNNEPSVLVFLSVYNGEKYLETQIDSIFKQQSVQVSINARIDGTLDHSIDILKKYIAQGYHINIAEGKNLGCEGSFQELIKSCNCEEYDYYAFADQDDYWYPDKLMHAVANLATQEGPALYCCNQEIADDALQVEGLMITEKQYPQVVARMQNNYLLNRHGCTMVWNKLLQQTISSFETHGYVPVHDKWLMLVARCCGVVIVDDFVGQKYRIHQNNASGKAQNIFERLRKGIWLYWRRDNLSDLYAKDCISQLVFRNHGMPEQFVKQVACYKDTMGNRIRLMFTKQVKEYGLMERWFWRVSILLGKF